MFLPELHEPLPIQDAKMIQHDHMTNDMHTKKNISEHHVFQPVSWAGTAFCASWASAMTSVP